MIHLDTNFLIQALVADSSEDKKLQTWLLENHDLGISTIAWSEFLCGPLTDKDRQAAQILFGAPEPFTAADAQRAADLFNSTGRRSRSLADCQITAVALRCNASLATANELDFVPFQRAGLRLI